MEIAFWNLLSECIIDNDFTEQRFLDCIKNVLYNFRYKELNISDIISFDKRIKLYSSDEVFKMKGQFPHPDFELKKIDENRFWIKKTDLINTGI